VITQNPSNIKTIYLFAVKYLHSMLLNEILYQMFYVNAGQLYNFGIFKHLGCFSINKVVKQPK